MKSLAIGAMVGIAVLVFICQATGERTTDYVFSVTGVVTTEGDSPVQDAKVTLEVDTAVYGGVTMIKTVQHTTDASGGFVFAYISHKRGVKYTITVDKEGFEPQTLSGSAPPASHHTIRLKKTGGSP
jgi:hypothetical protein